MINFFLKVMFYLSSQENCFLGEGWGIKDVRGPYLNGPIGIVKLHNSILSKSIGSNITIVLSTSNRCPIDSISITVKLNDKEITTHIKRNSSQEVVFVEVLANHKQETQILICDTSISSNATIEYLDIISIDEITIER